MSALPAPYQPSTAFAQHSVSRPGEPHRGELLDGEFTSLAVSVRETQARLAEIQNDDGTLGNLVVHLLSLSLQVREMLIAGIDPQGPWLPETRYPFRAYVEYGGAGYIATALHDSTSDFVADRAAGKWLIVCAAGTSALSAAFCPSAWSELFVRSQNAAEARTALKLEDVAGPGLAFNHATDELHVSIGEEERAALPYDSDWEFLVEGADRRLRRMSLAQLATLTAASAAASPRPNGIYREFNH